MSGYSPEIEQAGITWGQLKKCSGDDYACTMVSAFMLVQVLDRKVFQNQSWDRCWRNQMIGSALGLMGMQVKYTKLGG